jgi:hypothetical protein
VTRPMFFPVYGFTGRIPFEQQTLAVFFTSSDAETFAMHGGEFEPRHIYCAPPIYDRRESGYRPIEKPSGYREWLAQIDAQLTETVGDPLLRRHAA